MRCRNLLLGSLLVALVTGPAHAEPRRLSPADLESLGVRVENSVEAVISPGPSAVAPPALKPDREPAAVDVRPRPKPAAPVPAPRPLPLLPVARPAPIVSGPLPLDAERLRAVALKPAGRVAAPPSAELQFPEPELTDAMAAAPATPPPAIVSPARLLELDADGLFAVGLGTHGSSGGEAP